MPELPEVETTKLGLRTFILKKTITKVHILQPKLRHQVPAFLSSILLKKTVLAINRRAKYLVIKFDIGILIVHLGMSGSLSVVRQHEIVDKHEHFIIDFANGDSLRLRDPRRFGCVLWCENNKTHPLLNSLGVEPLSNDFNVDFLSKNIKNKTRSIKSLLMDSKIVVGIGNIYVLEALFLAGVSPLTPSQKLTKTQISKLVRYTKQVLKDAIKQGGTTLRDFTSPDKQIGYFVQKLQVYGRENKTCFVCGDIIIKIRQNQRSSYYCPTCQNNN